MSIGRTENEKDNDRPAEFKHLQPQPQLRVKREQLIMKDTKTGLLYPSKVSIGKFFAREYDLNPYDKFVWYRICSQAPGRFVQATPEEAKQFVKDDYNALYSKWEAAEQKSKDAARDKKAAMYTEAKNSGIMMDTVNGNLYESKAAIGKAFAGILGGDPDEPLAWFLVEELSQKRRFVRADEDHIKLYWSDKRRLFLDDYRKGGIGTGAKMKFHADIEPSKWGIPIGLKLNKKRIGIGFLCFWMELSKDDNK